MALTVTLFASIFAFVTSFPSPPAQNNNQFQASVVLTSNGANLSAIHILHLAGPVVAGNALVYLKSANQPNAPEFQNPYTVSSGISGSNVWNLGQVWILPFTNPNLPSSSGNISVYLVASSQLLFSVILPGASPVVPPTIVSTSISPASPTVSGAFTVYATITGSYTVNSVYINLAAVPGAPTTAQKMTLNSQGQWTYSVGAGVTTTSGTFYAFVNASSPSGSGGLQATAAVVIPISTVGTTNGPFSVGVILIPSPPNAGATETIQAVVTYTGVLSTPASLSVAFTAISSPYSAPVKWTGSAPSGAMISGGTAVTVVSTTTWTIPSTWTTPSVTAGTSFIVYANATVAGVGTVPGTMSFTPDYLSLGATTGGLIGSSFTATGTAYAAGTAVTVSLSGIVLTPTGGTSCTHTGASITAIGGGFVCTFTVPAGTPYTASTVYATDSTTGQNATAPFAVSDWTISLSVTSGIIGLSVTVTAVNFAATSGVTLTFEGIAVSTTSCTAGAGTPGATTTTNSVGGFACVIAIPAGSAPGAVGTLVASNSAWGATAIATFTVTAWTISLSPNSGVVGTSVTITGTGFAVSSAVVLLYDGYYTVTTTSCTAGLGTPGATTTTNSAGSFTCVFTMPTGSDPGFGYLVATDASGAQTAQYGFTVTAWTISLSASTGLMGTSVTVTGTGFAVSSGVVLTFEGITLIPTGCTVDTSLSGSTITVTAAGAFTCAVLIPSGSLAGLGTLLATDASGGQTATASFTVTAWTVTYTCPTTCPHGTSETITVTGAGFAASSTVVFAYNGVSIAPAAACTSGTVTGTNTVTVTPTGGFVCTFLIGTNGAIGTYTFVTTDSTSGQTVTTYVVRS